MATQADLAGLFPWETNPPSPPSPVLTGGVGSFVVGTAVNVASQIASPWIQLALSDLRYDLGWNDVSNNRAQLYALQSRSTKPQNGNDLLSRAFTPIRLTVSDSIRLYNGTGTDQENQGTARLAVNLANSGVTITPLTFEPAQGAQTAAFKRYADNVDDWRRLIKMSATAAPLGQVIHDWHRGGVPDVELNFGFERGGVKREADRSRMLYPFARWSPLDVLKLRSAGEIDDQQATSMFNAAGLSNEIDLTFLKELANPRDPATVLSLFRRGSFDETQARKLLGLAGVVDEFTQDAYLRLQWKAPESRELMASAIRNAFDEQLVARYGLDQGVDTNPMVRYWMQAQGIVGPPGSPAPGAHDGPTDWMKYYWRGAHPLIGFETALELQYRLRPSAGDPTQSVVAGAPVWTRQNTLDSLRMAGYSDVQAKWLQGLTNQPINIRLINHILGPFAHHADVRAAADQAFGLGVDWVKGAMLDHGFSEPYATVAAAGIHAQAEDRNNAEMIEGQKLQRKQFRELLLKEYALGTSNRNLVVASIVDDQFNDDMAVAAVELVDRELDYELAGSHLAAIKDGYMTGKLSLEQVSAQMTALNLTDARKIHYVQEWTWKRNDNQRMLSTGEILSALKKGLLTPALALTRLTNLGWTQPDALVEIAQVEHDLAAAAQHQQMAAASKAIAAQMKADRQAVAEARRAQAERTKEAKEALKAAQSAERLPLEQTINIAKYDATALLDFAAYNKAIEKDDVLKANAELEKAQKAYAEVLLAQLKLRQQNPEVAHEVVTVSELVNPSAAPSARPGEASTNPAQPPG